MKKFALLVYGFFVLTGVSSAVLIGRATYVLTNSADAGVLVGVGVFNFLLALSLGINSLMLMRKE